ncbi:MAG: Spermidine N(1)-acetyltransferase [Flavobacterium sp. SCGC AAA160-P02]|nr:MAG: Spermidine N(1)-acetyltransferase [Flavobacterium sp. SCGC AAA160-P02]
MILQGEKVILRALEPEDLDFLFTTENDVTFWEVSNTQTPFSRFILKKYIDNSHLDIYQVKQLRLIISEIDKKRAIGMVDIFDFNPQHKRAGVGILIHKKFQNSGFASEAVSLVVNYCFKILNLHQLFANITPDNPKSISLFTKQGFMKIGEKKDWLLVNGNFKDEIIFQLIND